MIRTRAARLIAVCLLPLWFASSAPAQVPGAPARPAAAPRAGGTITAIQVQGNQRIETATILSYMLVQPGDSFDADRLDRSLKTLYATGLFQDVRLGREGDTLVVRLVENPLVNRVAFEGNRKLSDDQLRMEAQLRPRAVFTPALAEQDRQRILDMYAKRGYYSARVDPQIIRLDQNRVDVVFQINDGTVTLISKIVFVGNHAFSENRLTEAINSREQRWWRFLSTSDEYDPERLNFDKELLRRFYLKNGYIDFEIRAAKAELAPDRSGFFLTFTLNEGERYRVRKVSISSQLRNLNGDDLRGDLQFDEGDWYDGDAVGRSVEAMERAVHNRGYAFVEVKPRVDRHPEERVVDLSFDVGEGPRVYVERIDIVGNTRTKDKVIRREFRLAEGDAFSAEAIRRSRQRLQDLNYFNGVNMATSQGSAPDKAIVTATIEEKATGELTLGGGYSTDAGALLDIGLSERNLIGSGISAGINGVLAQRRSSITASITDPYFLDRNLVAGADLFLIQTSYLGTQPYDEKRVGFDVRAGYDFNEYLRQVWTYSLIGRTVFNVADNASIYIRQLAGYSLLSQVSQSISLDRRDSRIDPRSGYMLSVGADFAGLGGNAKFIRTNINGQYFVPLERYFGNPEWNIAITAGAGYLFNMGQQEDIIDRFFLGGDNLRGFQIGGAGPHDAVTGDPLGGRLIVTQSTELRFPLPVSQDLGLSGRAFVDIGTLSQASFQNSSCFVGNPPTPCLIVGSGGFRMGIGVGLSWHTQFGLINIDLTPFVIKQSLDQTQVFRFGFGTRFSVIQNRFSAAAVLAAATLFACLSPASAQQNQQWFVPNQPRPAAPQAQRPAPRPAPQAEAPPLLTDGPNEGQQQQQVQVQLPPPPEVPPLPKGPTPPAAIVGVLSVADVMRASTAFQAADKEFVARRQKLNEDAQKEQVALRDFNQALVNERAKLSPEQIRNREKELQDRIAESRRVFGDRNRIVQEASQYVMAQIDRAVELVTQQVAISRGINLVLNRAQILGTTSDFDLTPAVVDALNKVLASVVIPPEGVSPVSMNPAQAGAQAPTPPAKPPAKPSAQQQQR